MGVFHLHENHYKQTLKEMDAKKKKKIILIGFGVTATGILSYFGFQYFKNRRAKKLQEQQDNNPPASSGSYLPSAGTPRNDEFPLHKGSKGAKVKALQEAILSKNGSSILPRYGADGDFGSEMTAALSKLGLPASIDESTFNVIVQGGASHGEIAGTLYKAAQSKNYSKAISTLKQIKTKDQYSTVSQEFMNYRLGGVRQTLVNGMLSSFPNSAQKQQISLEFSRMGLRYDGNKWSLSGLDGNSIITCEDTMIRSESKQDIKVPVNAVLGTEIGRKNGLSLFENNGEKFLVKTSSIKYL